MTRSRLVSREERFPTIGSTNDVVRDWLADGTSEVCLAIADEQTAGRGREDRRWLAPPGSGLLLSLGFRPRYLEPDRTWQLAAAVSLAMAEAAERVADLEPGTIRLKWPNDLVVDDAEPPRKLAGVLGETDGLGTEDPRAVVGIGVNVDWAAVDFPTELADGMTSLGEIAGRSVDRELLLDTFLDRLDDHAERLRAGRFDLAGWVDRQMTTERALVIELPDNALEHVIGRGVNPRTGGLVVEDSAGERRELLSAEIRHVRLAAVETSSVRFRIGV